MNKHFMVDIETTGIQSAEHDLQQIGILELNWSKTAGVWMPGQQFELLQHSAKKPRSEFARKHQGDLYARANAAVFTHPAAIRRQILGFILGCGVENAEKTFFMGWNASHFDIPFLCDKGCLIAPGYVTEADGKDKAVGDFNYRIYEIGGAVSLAQNALQLERPEILVKAEELGTGTLAMPEGKEHDAIFDCYKQTRLLNGLIKLMRGEE